MNVFSLFAANQAVAFANMSRSIWTWRSLRRNSISSWRSFAVNGPDVGFALGGLTELLGAPIRSRCPICSRGGVRVKFFGYVVGAATRLYKLNKWLAVLR